MFEQYVTIACVSNEVGGKLVGNAKWTGVRLRDVLEIAGVQPAATQLVGRSVDGWTAGMPTAWVMDPAREPMIALKMNDEPLPPAHGYPARLIVPGLYGYVSATKWLTELELTTLEAFDGYWVPLGWAKEAPILTQSRIDTPRGGVAPGQVADRRASPGRPTAASRGSRSRSTAPGATPGCRRRSPTRPGSSGSPTGRRRPASTSSGPRDRRDRRRPERAAVAAGARRRPRLAHDHRPASAERTAAGPRLGRPFRYRVRSWLDVAISSIRPSASSPAPSASRATGRSSSRPATARASSASCSRRSRSPSSPTGWASSCPSSSGAGSRRRGRRCGARVGDDTGPLDEPLNEAFRAGSLTLGWDGDDERVLVEARAQSEDGEPIDPDEDDDEDEDGPDLLRVRMTAEAARSFVARATRIVASGRPPCPLCGAPLDPQGHICPRRNGHYVN